MVRDEGSASVQVLIVIVAVGIIITAAAYALMSSAVVIRSGEASSRPSSWLERSAEVIDAIVSDATPSSDSPGDIVFSVANKVGVHIEDASSRVNPNWVNPRFLTDTVLTSFINPDRGVDELSSDREERGLSTQVRERFSEFFSPEAFDTLLTGYSYGNVNSSDEVALATQFYEASGNAAAAESFLGTLRADRSSRKTYLPSELQALVGPYRDTVGASLTTEGQMNVNFVDPLVLEALLNYSPLGIKSPSAALAAILESRAQGELTVERVASMLGIATTHPLFSYLGDDTWFWRVSIEEDDLGTYEAVYARLLPIPGEAAKTVTEKKPVLVAWKASP